MRSFALFLYLMVATLVAAAPTRHSESDETFYDEPNGFERYEVGAILKLRKLDTSLQSYHFPQYAKNVWQLMVRSLDSSDNPATAITTLIEPFHGNSSRVLSYQFSEDLNLIECALSFANQYDSTINSNIVIEGQLAFISAALQKGWWVNAPNFEGPKSVAFAGRQAGYDALFSLKGMLESSELTGLDPKAEIVIAGVSSGSMASGWAAALQPKYAPELKSQIKGVSLGGFQTNITAIFAAVDGTPFSALIANSLVGISNSYPVFGSKMKEALPPTTWRLINQAGKKCLLLGSSFMQNSAVFSGQNRLVPTGDRIFKESYVADVLEKNTLGINKHEVPQVPVFIYHALNDNIVPFKESNDAFNKWAKWGAESVEFAASESSNHLSESILGSPAAFTWISNRFDGIPPIEGCKQTVRHNNLLYPGISAEAFDIVSSTIQGLYGEEIGPISKRAMVELDTRDAGSFISSIEGFFGSVFNGLFGGSLGGSGGSGGTTAGPQGCVPPTSLTSPTTPKTTQTPPPTTLVTSTLPPTTSATPTAAVTPPPTTSSTPSGSNNNGGILGWLGGLLGGLFNGGANGGGSANASVPGASAGASAAASAYVGPSGVNAGGLVGGGVTVTCVPSWWNLWSCKS